MNTNIEWFETSLITPKEENSYIGLLGLFENERGEGIFCVCCVYLGSSGWTRMNKHLIYEECEAPKYWAVEPIWDESIENGD